MFYSISHHQDFKNERTIPSPLARIAIKIRVQVFMKLDIGRGLRQLRPARLILPLHSGFRFLIKAVDKIAAELLSIVFEH